MTHHYCFQGDDSRFRPPSIGFQCSETLTADTIEDEFGLSVITFTCTLPNTDKKLSFACREPSCGVLIDNEKAAIKPETGAMDPNFFDAGYTLAGRTGFQLWPASRLLVEALMWPYNGDCDRLQEWQKKLLMNTEKPLHVMELGAGVGMVGSCLASAGAHVVMTDLPTLVEHSIEPNLIRNSVRDNEKCPEWLQSISAFKIGQGWATATSLDWTIPVEQQISTSMLSNIDVVVASDCVWLVSMLDSLLDTVAGIFQHSPRAKLLMSFQRRDSAQGNANSMFTTVDRVLADIKDHGWAVDCLTWQSMVNSEGDSKEVFLFEIGLSV